MAAAGGKPRRGGLFIERAEHQPTLQPSQIFKLPADPKVLGRRKTKREQSGALVCYKQATPTGFGEQRQGLATSSRFHSAENSEEPHFEAALELAARKVFNWLKTSSKMSGGTAMPRTLG